ncbi:MAG: HNH endonuclease [Rhizomicrobium sp.]
MAVRRRPPRRKRTIPKHIREAVIARDLGRKAFDPSKHHIDHIWPFSRGGSHTTDNLRVIHRKQNLRKGAKRPRLWDMW